MTTTTDKTDMDIKNDVLNQLKYEPSVEATDIGVLVKGNTVTLTGYASSYSRKADAVRAARRIAGVRAIDDEIQVNLPDSNIRTDGDIASAAANQISWHAKIPSGTVKVTVREGRLTLEGDLEWQYQREAAENSVHHLAGVKSVYNLINIRTKLIPRDLETAIQLAFERSAVVDAENIQVETSGSKVTLYGMVRNHFELEEAERTAWAAPGVLSVENHLTVDWLGSANRDAS